MWPWLLSSVALGAFGQICMSVAMKTAGPVPRSAPFAELFWYYAQAALSVPMAGAVACYALSFVLWLGVLSTKDLSLARPLMSLGYLITLAYGYYAGEHVTWERVLGTVLIILGLFFVVRSDFHLSRTPGSGLSERAAAAVAPRPSDRTQL